MRPDLRNRWHYLEEDDDERQMLCVDEEPPNCHAEEDTPLQRGLLVGGIAVVGMLVAALLV